MAGCGFCGEGVGPLVEEFVGDELAVFQQDAKFQPPRGVWFGQFDFVAVLDCQGCEFASLWVQAVAPIDDDWGNVLNESVAEACEVPLTSGWQLFFVEVVDLIVGAMKNSADRTPGPILPRGFRTVGLSLPGIRSAGAVLSRRSWKSDTPSIKNDRPEFIPSGRLSNVV